MSTRKLCKQVGEDVLDVFLTCLFISAPAWSSHNKQSGWPPNAAMWVGVCANLEVTAFTPQPTWTSRITHSSCQRYTHKKSLKTARNKTCAAVIHCFWVANAAGRDRYSRLRGAISHCASESLEFPHLLALGMHPIHVKATSISPGLPFFSWL